MKLLKAAALLAKMLASGSKSVPCDAVAKVRSDDLCSMVKVTVFVITVLNVLSAVSLTGATSHPYNALGNFAHLMIFAFCS